MSGLLGLRYVCVQPLAHADPLLLDIPECLIEVSDRLIAVHDLKVDLYTPQRLEPALRIDLVSRVAFPVLFLLVFVGSLYL